MHMLLRRKSVQKNNQIPWFDTELTGLSRYKAKLYKLFLKVRTDEVWVKFKETRQKCQRLFKMKKAKFFNTVVEENKTNSRKLWSIFNPYLNPNKKSSGHIQLNQDDKTYSSPEEVSEFFADAFGSIVSSDANFPSIEQSIHHNESFIPTNLAISDISYLSQFKINGILPEETKNIFKKMKKNSSPGYVGIPIKVFSEAIDNLVTPITLIFNRCLQTGVIPDEWNVAIVTPIYKGKGSKFDFNSYRPISVISPISKAFETIIARRLIDYFEENNLFSDHQFGFRKQLSTEIALNTIIENWRESIDRGDWTLAIFIDLRKAFDLVDHQLLISKLKLYNLNNKVVKLLESYLANRLYIVKYNNCFSYLKALTTGVP